MLARFPLASLISSVSGPSRPLACRRERSEAIQNTTREEVTASSQGPLAAADDQRRFSQAERSWWCVNRNGACIAALPETKHKWVVVECAEPIGAAAQMESRRMQVERVLREYGQFIRPMSEAPRDGQRILAHAGSGHLVSCYWETSPALLIGPIWVEEKDSSGGYLDRYFDGWIHPRDFRLLDATGINRLLVAYIDDARAADNLDAIKVLEQV